MREESALPGSPSAPVETPRIGAGRSRDRSLPGSRYRLRCLGCGRAFEDDGIILECPARHEPALLVTEYAERRFEPDERAAGMFRYGRWLPGTPPPSGAGGGVTYRSERLGGLLGLSEVWVSFNGYWPERGATLRTATFKDLEAWSVLSRIPDSHEEVLVLASAGNTAAAFARACSSGGVPCLIVVPEAALSGLRLSGAVDPCVKVVSLAGGDYSDAIALADRLAGLDGFFPEGGAKNVARRDGLGTAMLDAAETMGRLPRYYFQAVASGAGAIAAWEAAQRLAGDGRFGTEPPRLMLSQNLPFVPVYTSWKRGRRELMEIEDGVAKEQVGRIVARVLSNRHPPYSIRGGLFDALTGTRGDVLAADNRETLRAKRLFEETEGIDIDPEGAVAFATLLRAARRGGIEPDAPVLLNITGGGRQRRDGELIPVTPALTLNAEETGSEEAPERVRSLFR